ncbi:hypothetical protein EMIHUDRAFT_222565 [Emiliania huxleyi CCMP1516]|uniref:Nudix hydrolase domain-containing protein n=2 Tax=Emiliania huxleyi TaxID=2903 RepID=A0A0D3KXK1_EMIH1|nr:hypothetical protein EMIHUDRAFT_222565 [Emiliania huxleyi CCMP1516]EOD40486.1 hypothetical protein EMIHUDRAFT_222565 [Emiliania huxleyi CCMP1516]|eukprot:XP_005792915.1 hypothetical protein EMIHUDRAFT_222565 [Emiliania huxleyi CCMP1516]
MPLGAIRKEAAEEAGVPPRLAGAIQPAGGVCYTGFDETGWALKRDVLYTFDLRCGDDFVPRAVDGEVEEFSLTPMDEVARLVERQAGERLFKPNVAVVIADFLLRRGFVAARSAAHATLRTVGRAQRTSAASRVASRLARERRRRVRAAAAAAEASRGDVRTTDNFHGG